jgi:hypothetical protein
MEIRYAALTLLITALFIPGVNAIHVSIYGGEGGSSGGSSVNLAIPHDETLNMRSILGESGGISQSLTGGGTIEESHFVQNANGDRAEISVGVTDAEYYDYSYSLYPGEGWGWSSKYVSAGETLTALNSAAIFAEARASNSGGDEALVRFGTSDALGKASILGYSNYAEASRGNAKASQQMESFSSQYNLNTNLLEDARNLRTVTNHELLSQADTGPFTLGEYYAAVSAENIETSVVADYTQLNTSTYRMYDSVIASKSINIGLDIDNIEYYSRQPLQVSAYSTKASYKGKKVTAESTLQVGCSPLDLHLFALIANPTSISRWDVASPGTYTAIAESDSKKAYVNVEQV